MNKIKLMSKESNWTWKTEQRNAMKKKKHIGENNSDGTKPT